MAISLIEVVEARRGVGPLAKYEVSRTLSRAEGSRALPDPPQRSRIAALPVAA